MKNLDQIAEDLFNMIRGRFANITIGDDSGKVTTDPAASRFYDFKFTTGDNELGSVSVALFDDRLSVMYNQNITKEAAPSEVDSWYEFLSDMRKFAKRRLLSFDTRDITKSNLTRRDYKFLSQDSQVVESAMYGSVRKSYQRVGKARINIAHTKPIQTENTSDRTRNIQAIFIESDQGERFRYPYRHLKGARAMARHVSEGGNPYDDFGRHLLGLSEELIKLNQFKRHVKRSPAMSEGLSEYVGVVQERVSNIKKELESAHTDAGYHKLIENFEKVILETVPDSVEMDWVDQLTVRQFNEELRGVFPYVYRLVAEHRKPTEIEPEYFLEDPENTI